MLKRRPDVADRIRERNGIVGVEWYIMACAGKVRKPALAGLGHPGLRLIEGSEVVN